MGVCMCVCVRSPSWETACRQRCGRRQGRLSNRRRGSWSWSWRSRNWRLPSTWRSRLGWRRRGPGRNWRGNKHTLCSKPHVSKVRHCGGLLWHWRNLKNVIILRQLLEHLFFLPYLISVIASSLSSPLQVAAGGRREEEAIQAPPGAAEGLAESQPRTGGIRQQYRGGYPFSSLLGLSGAPGSAGFSPEEPPAPGGKKERGVWIGSVCSRFNALKTLIRNFFVWFSYSRRCKRSWGTPVNTYGTGTSSWTVWWHPSLPEVQYAPNLASKTE